MYYSEELATKRPPACWPRFEPYLVAGRRDAKPLYRNTMADYAMLIHPRPMCPRPRPKILGCCIPWTKCPLAILPLTEPSHPFDWIERSDTRLPAAARFSAAKRWSSMCGPSVHPCLTRSRVGKHRSGTQYPRDALFKGRNIQEFSFGDTSVGDTSTLHRYMKRDNLSLSMYNVVEYVILTTQCSSEDR